MRFSLPVCLSFPWGRAAAALALALSLPGCASMGDDISLAFADPAKYDLYDCKQLEPERKRLAARTAELQGLMAKAETGAAGAVVAEVAYRNEYIATRGQAKLADQAWQKNRCRDTMPGEAMPVAPRPTPPAQPSRAGRSVY
ncbi:MAG: twin-arginine translocation pathway signal [Bradyrhizobium sp.]|nr:twin-arginine translocation pathway signal [Bradyrhizobium sp.]